MNWIRKEKQRKKEKDRKKEKGRKKRKGKKEKERKGKKKKRKQKKEKEKKKEKERKKRKEKKKKKRKEKKEKERKKKEMGVAFGIWFEEILRNGWFLTFDGSNGKTCFFLTFSWLPYRGPYAIDTYIDCPIEGPIET